MPRTLAQWTGVAVAAIVVSGSDIDLLLAVPLGILAGALAIFFSSLAERAGQARPEQAVGTVLVLVIGRARDLLAKIPHLRALGACVLALFAGMWIGSFIETGRAMERESMAVATALAKAIAERDEDARTERDAAVSEALSQSRTETKRQLDKAAAADAITINAHSRRVDTARRLIRAALEEETLTDEELRYINTVLAEGRDILLQARGTDRAGG